MTIFIASVIIFLIIVIILLLKEAWHDLNYYDVGMGILQLGVVVVLIGLITLLTEYL